MLKVGDRVFISGNSLFFSRNGYINPIWTFGYVDEVRESGSLPISVIWCNGASNCYSEEDLLLVNTQEECDIARMCYGI